VRSLVRFVARPGFALLLLVVSCARPEPPAAERDAPASAVPGLETAVAEEGQVRDAFAAGGAVVADADLPEVRDTRALLTEAEARRRLAFEQLQRLEPLARGSIAPRKELEAARAEEAAATAAAERAQTALSAFGRGDTARPLAAAEAWVVAQVLQTDIGRCAPGSAVEFVADAFPGRTFRGSLEASPSYVDPATRMAPAPLRLADADGVLRPGMTGRVTVRGAPRLALAVPRSAVVVDGDSTVVLLAREGGGFASRPVTIGASDGDRVEIERGLERGDRVATTGAASLVSAQRLPAAAEEGD